MTCRSAIGSRLLFRCRELRELARGSFAELIEALSVREPVRQHAATFRAYVDRALLDGRVLLLVDGLDEISDPGDRAAFVCTLRTAIQAYPGTALVVTSREAGFPAYGRASGCDLHPSATLSPFDAEDIRTTDRSVAPRSRRRYRESARRRRTTRPHNYRE